MTPDGQTSAQLATFEPALAEAVVTVLEREGIATAVAPVDHHEVEVRVPADRRAEALAVLANRMEQIQDLVTQPDTVTVTPLSSAGGEAWPPEDETGPPIVMDRLRRMSLPLVMLLAPLLVITLATALPLGYALALFILGLVAIVYWHNRQDDGA